MSDKRIKLIYFSTQGSDVRHLNLSWKKLSLLTLTSFLVVLVLVGSIFAVFTDFYHNFKIESLSRVNTVLTKQLSEMELKVRTINERMKALEVRDNDLRVFVNLPKIDEGTWNVGTGGSYAPDEYELRFLSKETGDQALVVTMLLDKLQRQIELAGKSQRDIEIAAKDRKMALAHTPSIKPLPGRISDSFGMRLDPFIDKVKHHDGIDIPAATGTKIVAPADGRVTKVVNNPKDKKGYGTKLEIDHGNGFTTLYAHLSRVLVKEGQTIKRWDPIAEVGNTGRSTAPHLHYEVHKDNRKVNPQHYIFNEE